MASASPLPLRILASFHTLFYAPLHVAYRLGAFAEEGLRARIAFSPQASETADRLLAGEADLAVCGPMRSYVAADRAARWFGQHLRAATEMARGLLAHERSQRRLFRTWSEVRGTRLATK